MRFGLNESVIVRIGAVFSNFLQIQRVVIYGSRAMRNYKTGSDIDLSIYGENLNSVIIAQISSELDDLLLPYTIDLSVFSQLDQQDLREHIERIGEIFYERSN